VFVLPNLQVATFLGTPLPPLTFPTSKPTAANLPGALLDTATPKVTATATTVSPLDTATPRAGAVPATTTPTPKPNSAASQILFTQGNDIYSMSPDGSNATRLTDGRTSYLLPAWSSAAQQIAFAATTGSALQVWRMKLDGGDKVLLWEMSRTSQVVGGWFSLTWSPDGKRLLLVTVGGGCAYDLYLLDVDSRNVNHLDTRQCGPIYPSWSPDGKKILRASYINQNWRVATINLDGSGLTALSPTSLAGAAESSLWSPDGTKIAFLLRTSDQRGRLYLMGANGENASEVPLGDASTQAGEAFAWSPNSSQIALGVKIGSLEYLYLLSRDNTERRLLAGPSARIDALAWSRDGRQIFFVKDGNALYQVQVDGGQPIKLQSASSGPISVTN
ncbi:MAG: hypothetical protein LC737_01715, partial [Chloroflexi bacterium]|nr:hypothetical protein [Chloroflexota bacterium]